MTRPATLLLLAVNLLLAGLLAWLWISPDGSVRGVRWVPPPAIRPDLGSLSASSIQREDPDANRLVAILDRPVFSPTRRPPPPPPPPKPVVAVRPDPLDSIHLFGLFRSADGGGVIAQVEGKTRRVKVSESIGDWSLKEINAREVVFTKAGQSRVVRLMQASQAAPGAAQRPAFSAPGGPPAPAMGPATSMPAAAPAAAQPPTPAPAPRPAAGGAAPKPAGPPASNPFVIGGSR